MTFSLQYHKDGKFQPVLRYESVEDAMAGAIGLAQASNYSPLRILNKNAAVVVSGKKMAEFLEATPEQQKEMMRQQGIITKAAEQMRREKEEPSPKAAMTLHWDDADGTHLYETFPCLDDALNQAAIIHGRGHTLTKLLNSWGEEATPLDQLRAVARMRCNEIIRKAFHRAETMRMEESELWGAF